ncbi:MAG TPA: hypothetical protein VIC70_05725 [Gaiellaceae bacterium]|jgi:hypothetical protein
MKLKGLFLLVTVAVAVAALWPAVSGAATFRGIVVARERGTLLIASSTGLVRAVSGHASLGARVTVGGGHAAVVGHASTARVRGIVVRSVGSTLFLSSNRHLLALHTMRRLADTTPTTPPAPGTVVSAQVGIANGQLDEQGEDDVGQVANGSISVQATVAAVAAGSVTLTVQGQTLTVPLPAGLTLPASLVGQTVTVQLSLGGDSNNNQGDDDGGGGGGGGGGGNQGGDGGGDG